MFNGQDLPHAITVPRDGPEHYGGYRWRKILRRSTELNKLERVLGYWCRTGDWQAMTVWVVIRKNKGNHSTAHGRYEREQWWKWKCDRVNVREFEEYEKEVKRRMREGVLLDEHVQG